MNNKTKQIIEENQRDLEKLHDQRRMWLWASSVVFWAIITIIFFWDWIDSLGSKSIWWFIVSCMLLLSINWWYWTMRVIRKLVSHQSVEYSLLKSILIDLAHVKKDIKKMSESYIDKSK